MAVNKEKAEVNKTGVCECNVFICECLFLCMLNTQMHHIWVNLTKIRVKSRNYILHKDEACFKIINIYKQTINKTLTPISIIHPVFVLFALYMSAAGAMI